MHISFKFLIGGAFGLLLGIGIEALPAEHVGTAKLVLKVVVLFLFSVWILEAWGVISMKDRINAYLREEEEKE